MGETLNAFFSRLNQYSDAIIVVLIVAILGAMVLPVPPFLLDILLTASITFSIVILMTTLYVQNPLQLSSFPSLLLLATLFRLSLNVATTRRILLHGNEGPDAAGHVIQAFGEFVVGGSYIVGAIVFVILVTINYIVITKGTERISEVAARFTLDALPGKQMAIDADLNAGIIDEKEAQRRRMQIQKEADFYGAMDGASKFIRGDAVAGIIIAIVNIIGGLAIGILQHHMDLQTALKNFTLLTVGDGLVSQIPSLVTSTAAGLMVTRAVSEENLGKEVFQQLTGFPKALYMASFSIFAMGIVPGMPFVPFMLFSAVIGVAAFLMNQMLKKKEVEKAEEQARELLKTAEEKEEKPEEMLPQPELITFEIGYALIPYVDESQNGEIVKRIRSLRKQLSKELGIIIPLIHIKDNLELKPGEYRILIRDIEVGRGEIYPDKLLAIDTGTTKGEIEGIRTKEPAFGLNAYWIDESLKDRAKMLGYTVVDIPTVVITHLSEIIKKHAHEVLGRMETKELINSLSARYPVVKEIVPEQVPLNIVHRVLQNLLKEGIPVKDLLTIIETLSDNITKTNDPEILTEFVRQSLSRMITSMYQKDNTLYALTLGPKTENYIMEKVQENGGSLPPFEPTFVQKLVNQLTEKAQQFVLHQATPVLLTSPATRRFVRKIIEPYLPDYVVLSYAEIEPKVKVNVLGVVDPYGD
ncbi:flagellar biosynthesis protein FlhA [Persephonella hydrogeniphila]|uniref:Flagellar biosynthesis protein FlhA n=1 Tax=Persephonella hydrogeniphila TaxID=198703 RepID=A0A285NF40_9AQUI|nr:flagellar biosynthesis protein FlhA [Persephonella hydrogeniphila]SNZ08122.1 flagellar biosynthesis protein FlhA [Persephonella hydrogeniphila]